MTDQLGALFDPSSVVVVGASATEGKWGYELARITLAGRHRRRIYLLNRNGGEILGEPVHATASSLPEQPDLAVVVVPHDVFEAAIDDLLAAGVKCIIGMTSGFGELGEEGRRLQQSIARKVVASGARLLGPNCLGVWDRTVEFDAAPFLGLPSGDVALISQSGGMAEEIGRYLMEDGSGFSRFVSIGNQSDISVAELVRSCAQHTETKVIALYVEDFLDGRAVFDAIGEARSTGRPVVVLNIPASAPVLRATQSHTGSLASDADVIRAACDASGALWVSTPRAMVDAIRALRCPVRARSRRVGLLGDTGGFVVVSAGAVTSEGLDLPSFSESLRSTIESEDLSPLASARNPIDLVNAATSATWASIADRVLSSDEVDALMIVGGFGTYTDYGIETAEEGEAAARRIAGLVERTAKPVVLATPAPTSHVATVLGQLGVPVYRDIEAAARSLRVLCDSGEPAGLPRLPADPEPATAIEGYFAARGLLAARGIDFPEAREVASLDQALAAADAIGFPVVLKAMGLLHKSDAGGVALGLRDETEVAAAYTDMERRLAPPSCAIERMLSEQGVELIVGTRQDSRFGPLLLVGLGGLFAEVFRDTQTLIAPCDAAQVEGALRRLRGAPLLLGSRGRPVLEIAAAAAVGVELSHLAAARPDLADIEVNPLLVTRTGAIALDARVIGRDDLNHITMMGEDDGDL